MFPHQLPDLADLVRVWPEVPNFASLTGSASPASLEPAPPRQGEEMWTPPQSSWSSGEIGSLESVRPAAPNRSMIDPSHNSCERWRVTVIPAPVLLISHGRAWRRTICSLHGRQSGFGRRDPWQLPPVPADRHPAFGEPCERIAHHPCDLSWLPTAVPTCPAQKETATAPGPGASPLQSLQQTRGARLGISVPCGAGMNVGASGVSGDSATRKVISVWSPSPHLVACHELAI